MPANACECLRVPASASPLIITHFTNSAEEHGTEEKEKNYDSTYD
jgi:hypothetical protein